MTHRDRSEYKTHSSVMAVCKSVTIPGMTGHVRRNTQRFTKAIALAEGLGFVPLAEAFRATGKFMEQEMILDE